MQKERGPARSGRSSPRGSGVIPKSRLRWYSFSPIRGSAAGAGVLPGDRRLAADLAGHERVAALLGRGALALRAARALAGAVLVVGAGGGRAHGLHAAFLVGVRGGLRAARRRLGGLLLLPGGLHRASFVCLRR